MIQSLRPVVVDARPQRLLRHISIRPRSYRSLIHDFSFDCVLVEDVLRRGLGYISNISQILQPAISKSLNIINLRFGGVATVGTELSIDPRINLRFRLMRRLNIFFILSTSVYLDCCGVLVCAVDFGEVV